MSISRVFVIINIAVFLAWQSINGNEDRFIFMAKNFLISWTALSEGRYWTLLTSVFSHNSLMHIFFNMYVLDSFGPVVEKVMGRWAYIKFYLAAGLFSSFCHAAVSAYLLNNANLPALGASGAISGIIFLFSLLFPKEKILIFGIVPMPALWGALAFVVLDIWGLVAQTGGGGLPIGHGAHLGGALAGVLYYFIFLRPKVAIYNRPL